jgi:group I intron endonuclease
MIRQFWLYSVVVARDPVTVLVAGQNRLESPFYLCKAREKSACLGSRRSEGGTPCGDQFCVCIKMYYTIYKTTCLLNGKFYIGKHQTKNLNDGYIGSGKWLTRAIKKHGIDNFVTEILAVYNTRHKMNLAEQILVVLDPEISYNLCPGGFGGFDHVNILNKGVPHFTKENAKQLSLKGCARKKELLNDPEWAAKYSEKMAANAVKSRAFRGRTHRELSLLKMSLIKKEHYKGAGNPNFGKKRTEESKKKTSNSVKATLAKKKLLHV